MTLSRGSCLRVVIIGAGFGGLSAAKQLANAGSMATIGRKRCGGTDRSVQGFGIRGMDLSSMALIHFLTFFCNRLAVAMHWCWNYVTSRRGTRLITGISGSRIEDVMPVLSTARALAVRAGDSGGTLP